MNYIEDDELKQYLLCNSVEIQKYINNKQLYFNAIIPAAK